MRVLRGTEHLDHDSYRLLVASLFTSPMTMIVGAIVATLLPYFSWLVAGQTSFLALTLAASATLLFRLATIMRYRRRDHSGDAVGEIKKWDREFFAGATLSSVILGLNCFFAITQSQSEPLHVITVASTIAFASGYVARNAGRPGFVLIQVFCFCVPSAVGLFITDRPFFHEIGYFMLLYIVTSVTITFSINRNLLALAAATKTSDTLAQTLRRKNVTLDSALNSMTHGLVMFDGGLKVEVSNSKFSELYGVPAESILPGTRFEQVLGHAVAAGTLTADPALELASTCRHALETRQPAAAEIAVDGERTFVVSFDPTADDGVLMLTEDATARKATAAQIERMAQYDSLTGLANRFMFGNALKDACTRLNASGHHFSVLYVDLDNFKHINDSLGHDSGDQLLVQTAERLKSIVGRRNLVARVGGDEFVLLVGGHTIAAATALGQQIVDTMAAPFLINGLTIYASTSVGIATAPEHGSDPADLLRAADIALYAAKAAGRSTATVFEPKMADALCRRREIENDLREAYQTGKLFVHYQPIVDLATGQVTSCETLMRWMHPTKGMISPDIFIPIAEQTGLISPMGDWVIRTACMDAAEWPRDISVAVNVSAIQFKDPKRLVHTVTEALRASGLEPNRLEIEVTESLLIEDQKATLEVMRALRRIGVRFSLDDFGVGYSSLAYLARYPFSKVKIDRTFAQHVTVDGPSRSIVEAVCQLAHRLGLRVVVEGIETEDQRNEVNSLGAEQAQGYLFGRPELAEDLIRRLMRAA